MRKNRGRRTCEGNHVPLGRFEESAHGDLVLVFGDAERVVVRVGLEIADVVV